MRRFPKERIKLGVVNEPEGFNSFGSSCCSRVSVWIRASGGHADQSPAPFAGARLQLERTLPRGSRRLRLGQPERLLRFRVNDGRLRYRLRRYIQLPAKRLARGRAARLQLDVFAQLADRDRD